MTEEQNTIIHPAELINLHKIGFKLVPLNESGKPVISWAPIYENPNYWTLEKLVQEAPNFKNVATVFGKNMTGKYLNELDIDSQKVYDILFGSSAFIDNAIKNTYVVKTRKPTGFHIFWLSEKQNKPVGHKDCKLGYEFEIKTDNTLGHSTLPPSRHRDDPDFEYKSYGQEKIFTRDELYDSIIKTLAECTKSEDDEKTTKTIKGELEFTDAKIETISKELCQYYNKGNRHELVFALSGVLRKANVSKDSTLNLVQILAKDDEEVRSRIDTVEQTYNKDPKTVTGSKYLLEILEHATGSYKTAKDFLQNLFRLIGIDISIKLIAETIMKEYTFATATDNSQLYQYNGKIYIPDQEWVIKQQCRLILPDLTSHDIDEVIKYIKDSTYIDRSVFDANPNIINFDNCLLNIKTLEKKEHSPDQYSLSCLPHTYDPKARCPKFANFLSQVLRPKDVSIMLQYIGYCLYKTAKYEKDVLCIGKGDNGKSTLLKAIERFLGSKNVSNVSLQDLASNRFAKAELYGKLVNTFADLKSDKLSSVGTFKMLTSGDPINAEFKHKQAFKFSNFAKLIFSCNDIPEVEDKGYAYFKRWIIFHFEHAFIGEQRDNDLIDKITTGQEMSGLLNLALISLRRLIEDNGFIHTDDIETVEKDYNENSAAIERFVMEKCIVTKNKDDYEISRDLWGAYLKYCKGDNITAKDDNVFGMELLQLHHIEKDRISVNHQQEYVYTGIKLKEKAD